MINYPSGWMHVYFLLKKMFFLVRSFSLSSLILTLMETFFRPGMNCCTISEEETTDTQRARFRLSVAGNHDGRLSHSVSTESSITFVNTWHDLDQNPQDLSFSGGKKKHEIKEVSNPAQYSLSKKLLISTRMNEHVSIERRLQNRSLPSWEKKLEKRLGIPHSN